MQIREAVQKDLSQLVQLFESYRGFYKKESDIEAANTFLTERLTQRDSRIFVAENEAQQLVGFVQLFPIFSSTRMKKMWLLNDLYVDATFRGQGVAVRLLQRAQQLARETAACGLLLETEKTNIIGNKLYPKMGFEVNNGSNFYEWNNN